MKTKLILAVFVANFMLFSCDDNLDILPQDNISAETLYQSKAGAMAGLAGIYSRIHRAYRTAVFNAVYPSSYTDEANYGRNGFSGYIKNNFTPSDPQLLAAWTELYRGVHAANLFLENVEKSENLDTATKKELLAEGYFVRGYLFLDIQRAFGWTAGVPMPLTENGTTGHLLPRTSGIDVYRQAIADFEKAEKDLPHDSEAIAGRPGKNAARGLIARCYLYMSGKPFDEAGAFEKVKEWTKKIIDDPYHELNPSYQNIYDNLAMERYERKEMLFQIGYSYALSDNQQASQLGSIYGILVEDEACFKSFEVNYASIVLTLKYRQDPNDERGWWNTSPYVIKRGRNCMPIGQTTQWRYTPSKYRRQLESNPQSTSWGSHHWPVLRYADILLMYAEAENEINPGSTEALNIVNQVRARAKGTPLTNINRALIQEERRLELCFEGHRKYDLLRWGVFEDRVLATKARMEELMADANFYNDDWPIYGEPNLGPDLIPQSGDEPAVLETRINAPHPSFNYFDGYNDFDITKHYILPIPEQEVSINPNLKQTQGW